MPQLSLVCGGFGFYVVTCLTMAIVFATAFLLVLLNLGEGSMAEHSFLVT